MHPYHPPPRPPFAWRACYLRVRCAPIRSCPLYLAIWLYARGPVDGANGGRRQASDVGALTSVPPQCGTSSKA
jgi:hypothetical protein